MEVEIVFQVIQYVSKRYSVKQQRSVHCTLYIAHCTLYNVQCTVYSVQRVYTRYTTICLVCTLAVFSRALMYIVQCTLYNAQCALYIVHCTCLYIQIPYRISLTKSTQNQISGYKFPCIKTLYIKPHHFIKPPRIKAPVSRVLCIYIYQIMYTGVLIQCDQCACVYESACLRACVRACVPDKVFCLELSSTNYHHSNYHHLMVYVIRTSSKASCMGIQAL